MRKLIAVAVLSVVGFAAWRWHASTATTPETLDARVLKDRVWIDHVPRNDRDIVNVFAVLTRDPVGVFQAASMWRGAYEGFRYEANGNELRAVFPQTGDREKLTVNARPCRDNGMDFCLDVTGSSRGVKRYYSKKGWEIGRLEDALPTVEAAVAP